MNIMLTARFIKFGLVGITGMAIDFLVTWLCKEKLRINRYLANSVGFCFAVTNNFLLNRYWTFETNNRSFVGQFTGFILVSVAGLLINNVLLFVLVKYARKNFYFLKLSVVGLVFFWNYFVNTLVTFN